MNKSTKTYHKPINVESIFKYVNILVVLVFLYCIPGFWKFRKYCEQHNYYVFSSESLIWCALGFAVYFQNIHISMQCATAYRAQYYKYIKGKIGQQKLNWSQNYLLTFSSTSVPPPSPTFSSITNTGFLQWWVEVDSALKYMSNTLIGLKIKNSKWNCIHAFSVFEMVVIKRKTNHKFYEYLLHHTIASSLIMFSMMCNQITAGTMILIIHDISDILMAGGRAFLQTIFVKYKPLQFLFYIFGMLSWLYFRILIFPLCLMTHVYYNKPNEQDQWYIIKFQYMYLLSVACILFLMHLYWTYYIIKTGIRGINKKKIVNVHERTNSQQD